MGSSRISRAELIRTLPNPAVKMLSSSKADQGISRERPLHFASLWFTLVHMDIVYHRVSHEAEHLKKTGQKPGCIRFRVNGKLGCTLSNWWEKSSASHLRPLVMKQNAARSGKVSVSEKQMPLVIFGSSERGDERHAPRVDFSWPKPRRFLVADFSTFRGNTCARGWSGNVVRTATSESDVFYDSDVLSCVVMVSILRFFFDDFFRTVFEKSGREVCLIPTSDFFQVQQAASPRLSTAARPRF